MRTITLMKIKRIRRKMRTLISTRTKKMKMKIHTSSTKRPM
jgi:hypothetical protein